METAVVTGAGRGIGREVARRLAARGYAVLATDLDPRSAAETAQMLGSNGWSMAHDVGDPEAHRAVAAAANARGPLTVWVNNAGVLRTDKVWNHSDAELRMLIDANLFGVIWGSRAAVDAIGGAGDIINMGSLSALGAVPGLAVYGATKHAVLAFTISMQGDLRAAGRPIRMHAFCPDVVATEMVSERAADDDSAILFSAAHLNRDEVADQIVSLVGSNKIVLTHPRARAILMRSFWPFPRVALPMLSVFRRVGERRKKRA